MNQFFHSSVGIMVGLLNVYCGLLILVVVCTSAPIGPTQSYQEPWLLHSVLPPMNGRPVESEKETKLNLLPSKGLSSDFLSSMIFQTNPWFDNERTLYTNNNNKQPTPITNSMTETGRIKEDVDTPPYEFPEDASISLEQVLVRGKGNFIRAVMWRALKGFQGETTNQQVLRITPGSMLDMIVTLFRKHHPQSETLFQQSRTCIDLQLLGHRLSGFYLLTSDQQMEIVYCNFKQDESTADLQRSIPGSN